MPQTRKTFGIWSLLVLRSQGISVYFEVMPWGTFLFARLFLPVNFIGFICLLIDWLYKQWKNTGVYLTENRKLPPLSPTHTPSSTPACFSFTSCVNTEGVFFLSGLLYCHTHTHVLLSYPKRKPYSIHSLQLCLINSVSFWLSYSLSHSSELFQR